MTHRNKELFLESSNHIWNQEEEIFKIGIKYFCLKNYQKKRNRKILFGLMIFIKHFLQ